jgi:23S rRNA (cytosine1962-C5)-methyltransferase
MTKDPIHPSPNRIQNELQAAWKWRQARGVLSELEAVRVFHGPGEGSGDLSRISIDRFGNHFWVTEWSATGEKDSAVGGGSNIQKVRTSLEAFFKEIGARSAVALIRPEKGLPEEPVTIFGEAPSERFEVREGEMKIRIQLLGARHPGLFLDHLPLRRWLKKRMQGLRVLNTFSYTGSLSVSAGLGGAAHVTTLDLSQPILAWAKENWECNSLPADRSRFISGDYFEWLPRLRKSGERFDCVILDPPSFSRGKKGTFSTSKDLRRLHVAAFEVLEPGGYLVTSINSANVPREKFEAEVWSAARECGLNAQVLHRIDLPETFPTRMANPEQRYLKGVILRISSGTGSSNVIRSRDMG